MPVFADESADRVHRWRRYAAIGALAVGGVALAWLLAVTAMRYGGQSIRQVAQQRVRGESIRNLEAIALAMNNYAADYGTYPPPVIRSETGQPMHSWRDVLLSYLGEEDLASRYDMNEAWDAAGNVELQYEMPRVFRHPVAGGGGYSTQSSYYLITGPGTLFPPTGPLGPEDVRDDPSQTILVIEGTPILTAGVWTEPVDLSVLRLGKDLRSAGGQTPGGLSDSGATLATVDGRGRFLRDSTEPMVLQALITPQGGEPLADDTLD